MQPAATDEIVKQFYAPDEISSIMPWTKDCVFLTQKASRFIFINDTLCNMKEAYLSRI
jgi:hypothetical protein